MSRKVFQRWDHVGTDTLIGGAERLVHQRIPPVFEGVSGLINPGDPEQVRRLRAEAASRTLAIEIGPGKGAFLCAMAEREPTTLWIGFEVRLAFCVRALRRAQRAGLDNVRLVWGDVRATLPMVLDQGMVREVYLLYPDPWWKRKQADRRYGPVLARLLADVLVPGGLLVIKSDVEEYLSELQDTFLATGRLHPHAVPEALPMTDRERKMSQEQPVASSEPQGREGLTKGFAAALVRR